MLRLCPGKQCVACMAGLAPPDSFALCIERATLVDAALVASLAYLTKPCIGLHGLPTTTPPLTNTLWHQYSSSSSSPDSQSCLLRAKAYFPRSSLVGSNTSSAAITASW